MAKKKKYKVKWKNVFKFFRTIILFTLLILTTISVITYFRDYKNTEKTLNRIKENVKIVNVVDDEFTEIIEPNSNISKFALYWNYIKLGLIEPDFIELSKVNPELIGWISIKGTNIDYPVAKHSDNDFYKSHTFDTSQSRFGAVYLDTFNDLSEIQKNTVIYSNKNNIGLLFDNLKVLNSASWQEDDDNYVIRFATKNYTTLWQIVSVYKTKDKVQTAFSSDEKYAEYLQSILDKSIFDFKTTLISTDNIITLTTNSEHKNTVVVAKLIKKRITNENTQE